MTEMAWCPWWADSQREEFVAAAERALRGHFGAGCEVDGDAGTATAVGIGAHFDLADAARHCAGEPQELWADLLHFNIDWLEDRAAADERRDAAFAVLEVFGKANELADVARDQRVRIVPVVDLPAIEPVAQWLPYGLAAALAQDDGSGPVFVDRRHAASWRPHNKAAEGGAVLGWSVGWLNTICEPEPRHSASENLGAAHDVYTTDGPSAAAHILDVEDRRWPNSVGTVVAAPAADTVLALEVCSGDRDLPRTLAAMAADSYARHRYAAQPISPHLMWSTGGAELCELARIDRQSVRLSVPAELDELLDEANGGRQLASKCQGMEL